jgi:hypothetical protein
MKIVIARYNEDLSWVNFINPCKMEHIIYNKGPDNIQPHYNVTKLDNIGKEAETYLQHIIQNYDNLHNDDYIMFCQGTPFDHMEQIIIGRERNGLNSGKGNPYEIVDFMNLYKPDIGFTPLGCWFACDHFAAPHFSHNMKEEFDMMFKNFDDPLIWFVQGAQFIVSTNRILHRPLSFYKKLLSRAIEVGQDTYAHVLERSWFYIFNPAFKH